MNRRQGRWRSWLLAKAEYADADRGRIVQLVPGLRDFVEINELREKLLIHHTNGTDEVRPEVRGRGDWVGGIRLLRSDVPTDAQKNTAFLVLKQPRSGGDGLLHRRREVDGL